MIIVCSEKHKKILEKVLAQKVPDVEIDHLALMPGAMVFVPNFSYQPVEFRIKKYLKKVYVLNETRFKLDFQPDYSKLVKP